MSVTASTSFRLAAPGRRLRLRRRSSWLATSLALLAFALVAFLSAPPARATGLRVVFANDFLTTNHFDDELYTGALAMELDKGPYRFAFGENMFTDSENDIRFDETYLSVERGLPALGEWQSSLEVGLIHVGKGLLGQSAQNAFHSVIGNEEVDLPYVESNRVHPTVRWRVHRLLPTLQRYALTLHGEVYSAVEFKQHVAGGLWMRFPEVGFATFTAGAGGRYTSASLAALKPRIERFAPTLEAGVRFRNNISLSWTYNEFGTKAEHFNIVYDIVSKKKRKAAAEQGVGWDRRWR